MRVLFFVSTKRTNKKGKSPIYCRITVNGQRSEISTGVFIHAKQWRNESMIETDPDAVLINAQLAKMKSDINRIYVDLTLKNRFVSCERIKDIFIGHSKSVYTFYELISEYVDHKLQFVVATNSVKNYNSKKKQIHGYLDKCKLTKILPEEFTTYTAENYYAYLKNVKKLSTNYINKNLQFIKSILNHGIKMDLIRSNPLSLLRLKHEKPKPIISLTKEELAKLENYQFVSKRLQQVADLYAFQSYTGFAYADLMDFDFQMHVRQTEFREYIFKTRVKVADCEAIIPLFEGAKRILVKYGYKLPQISNQRYNSYLKEIVDIVGIDKELTTHTARKTFAMIKINEEGWAIEPVSRMLGHNSTKVTQTTYATVGLARIEHEIQKTGTK